MAVPARQLAREGVPRTPPVSVMTAWLAGLRSFSAVVGVVFDLFETLVTEGPLWLQRSYGVPSWKERAAVRLEVPEDTFRRVWARLKEHRLTERTPYADVLHGICDEAGVPSEPSAIDELVRERQAAKAAPFLNVDTGVVAMLDELAALGTPMAVLSNCSGEEVEMLPSSAIGTRIAHRLLSCDIGSAKPAREAYLAASERLGLIPEDCFFVGDGSSDELVGARAAGMRPIWATWFMSGWPCDLAVAHEARVAEQQVERADSPADIVAVVRSAIATRA